MTEFADTNWSGGAFVKAYLGDAQHYLPERSLLISVMVSFFRHQFRRRERARVLDLGTGDGNVSAALLEADPTISLSAVDGSADMIAAARSRLGAHFCCEL